MVEGEGGPGPLSEVGSGVNDGTGTMPSVAAGQVLDSARLQPAASGADRSAEVKKKAQPLATISIHKRLAAACSKRRREAIT